MASTTKRAIKTPLPKTAKRHIKTKEATELGLALRLARVSVLKATGTQVGAVIGFDKGNYSKLENDERDFMLHDVLALCRNIEIRPSVLMIAAECFNEHRSYTGNEVSLCKQIPDMARRLSDLLRHL